MQWCRKVLVVVYQNIIRLAFISNSTSPIREKVCVNTYIVEHTIMFVFLVKNPIQLVLLWTITPNQKGFVLQLRYIDFLFHNHFSKGNAPKVPEADQSPIHLRGLVLPRGCAFYVWLVVSG